VHLVRYAERTDLVPRVGILDHAGIRPLAVESLGALLGRSASEIGELVEAAADPDTPAADAVVLPPVDGRMEVWAAGVTYLRSREARMEESATADIYQLVYEAERPEVFFKAVPWRVVTGGEPIAIRRDSKLNVPEAELAVVVNARGEIVGYTVCNDVSSRTIEGANPLYLPQAKVYAGSCALAGGIRPAWEVDPSDLAITLVVERAGAAAWSGRTTTGRLHRSLADLVDCLFAEEQFPDGVVISTGTGIVPELEFTLAPGDVVTIDVEEVGTLSNPVTAGKPGLAWLAGPVSGRPGAGG
jgi:2-dehydro-3-deoxy-D-arabinonate dehydratase